MEEKSFSASSRRGFMKKSFISAIAAAQPIYLAGLIRANGDGGGTGSTGTTEPKTETVTTDPFTTMPLTTEPFGFDTTHAPEEETTVIPEETSVPETTVYL